MNTTTTIDTGIPFVPTERQRQFMGAVMHADEIGYGGALGGGKSYSLCWFAHYMSTAFPGNRGAVFRESLVDLRETTLNEFKIFMNRHYPHQPIKWRMSPQIECEIDCGNGIKSVILWLETKDPEKHLSLNIGWAAFDEASQVSNDAYLTISGRVGRHRLPSGELAPSKLAWGTNPGPGWCKDEFPVGPVPAKRTLTLDNGTEHVLAFVPALHSDNPHLDPNYVPKLRKKYPTQWINRLLKGDWNAFEGQIFTEFDPTPGGRHLLEYLPCREKVKLSGWMHIFGMDWGFQSEAAALCCSVDYDGTWWIWDEYYESGRTPDKTAPYLLEMIEGIRFTAQVFDYAAGDQSTGTNIIDMFNKLGFDFWPCSKRKHGADGSIMFLKKLLEDDKIRIAPNCINLVFEILNARWKKQTAAQAMQENPKDQMVDKDDHALDALFYAFEFWRQKPDIPTPPLVTRETAIAWDAAKMEDERANRRQLSDVIHAHNRLSDNFLTHRANDDSYFDTFGEERY